MRSNTRWRLLVLLAVTFALKLLVLWQLKDHPLTQPESGLDTTAYVHLARDVVGGNLGLGPGLYYVSPFYIYFLAAILCISDSFLVVRIVQIALGTAAVGLMFLTARRWFGVRAAWVTSALAVLTGLFTFYEVLLLQSSVDVFFTALALWALTVGLTGNLRRDRDLRPVRDLGFLASGLVWGVQSLNRPNVVLAAVGVALVAGLALRRVKPAVLLLAGVLVGLAPVAIRNVVVANQWSLVSSHGGLNFYIGNAPEATGFYRLVPGVKPTITGQETDTKRIAERATGRSMTDAEVSDYFFDLGWTWIKAHPADAAGLFLKKLAFAFHAQTLPLPHSYPFFAYDSGTALRFYAIGPWLLAPLGLVGLVAAADRARPREYLVWVSFVGSYAAAIALFFIAERYRLPLLVPLAIGAGAAIDRAWSAFRARQWTPLAAGAVAAALLALFVNYRFKLDDGRWLDGLRLAERLVIGERYEEADRWAQWLETHHPPKAGAGVFGVGQQLLAIERTDRAMTYLERAHQIDPSDPLYDYTYGQALLKSGRVAEALSHLQHGFDGGVALPSGGADYAVALQQAGDAAGAVAALRRITPADDGDPESWLRLGRIGMEVKAPEIAEPYFRRAVAIAPQSAAARQQYGLNLLILRRYDAAAAELAEAARLDPRDADTLAHLAYCETQLGRDADARTHVAAALAIDPNQPLARQLAAAFR
jgi:Tfp pilus assembly protein PilF/4-amino-4-deoxy-L-arabinose transferase-like glycosyltransferase